MATCRFQISTEPRQRGIALLLVLSLLSLVLILGLAFVEKASVARQIARSGCSRVAAQALANGAINVVIGDLRQELAANAQDPPKVPSRNSGNSKHLNLLKRSAGGEPSYPGGRVRVTSDPANSSVIPALSGRVMDSKRWNKSYLLARAESASPNDTTPTDFQAPDWVLVTRHSAGVDSSSKPLGRGQLPSMTDPNSPDHVLGRYAFLIFDEGSLLDVNAAGFPAGLNATQIGRKGWLAFSDLRQVGLSAGTPNQIDRLVGWRNFGVARPDRTASGNFYSYDFTHWNSVTRKTALESFFEAVISGNADPMRAIPTAIFQGSTDQRFIGRLELLQFRRATGFSDKALQYLGTFSRELNQPSFAPKPGRAQLVGNTQNGGNDVFDPADPKADRINPRLLGIRVGGSGMVRCDGSVARPGEPLVGQRFALSRMAWVTFQGPSAEVGGDPEGTAENILGYFGLSWDLAKQHWVYVHRGARPIALLEEVRDLGREPDFFELLKAGIAAGSLGKCARWVLETGVYEPNFRQKERDGSLDRQVFQIGANIIDQSDSDSFPTTLRVPGVDWEIWGSEDLPGLYRIHLEAVRVGENSGVALIEPELWNPYDWRSLVGQPGPTRFRIILEADGLSFVGPATPRTDPITPANSALEFTVADRGAFRHPTIVRNGNDFLPGTGNTTGAVSTPYNVYDSASDPVFTVLPGGTAKLAGFRVGTTTWSQGSQVSATLVAPGGLRFRLEYERDGWHPYQELWIASGAEAGLTMVWPWDGTLKAKAASVCDPRTDRFGVAWTKTETYPVRAFTSYAKPPILSSGTNLLHDSMRPLAEFTAQYAAEFGLAQNGGWIGDPSAFFLGCLSENMGPGPYAGRTGPAQSCYYADPDGVVRRAMGAYAGSGLAGLPTVTPVVGTDWSNRPFFLNRPFQNVAELGYVFRGSPWRNLDFFTPESGDSALLDLFCVAETKRLVGGRVNLNTPHIPVLKAALASATRDVMGTSFLSLPECERIARVLVAQHGIGNPAELVGFGDGTGFSGELGSCYDPNSSGSFSVVQRYRETALRALVDIGSTRVWNLMIDLVAQTGRFPKSATSLDQFVVEGEKRVWVHLAVDRFTGEILDRLVEAVGE